MTITNAAAGETINASAQFLDEDDDPVLTIKPPVTWRIFAPNRSMVLEGTGVQDSVDPSLFTAVFTLPSSAPATGAGENYQLKWNARTTAGATFSQVELFELTNSGDVPDTVSPMNVVAIPGQPFIDQIKIMNVSPAPTVSYSIIDETGAVIATSQPSGPVIVGKYAVYTVAFAADAIPVPQGVQQHYLGNWVLSGGLLSAPEVESHAVYVMTPVMQTIAQAMYVKLGKGILENVEPFLSWTAGEYAHHITKAFDYINGQKPRVTGYSIKGPLPTGMTHYLEVAAMRSALQAQLFAYQSSWDFQGLGVQLTVNRSEVISTMISSFEAELEKVPEIKTNWLYSGSPSSLASAGLASRMPLSVTGITLSPSTNFAAPNIPFQAIVPSVYLINARGLSSSNRRL